MKLKCNTLGCTNSTPVETGLYYLQSRYYDPEIGRFISADDVSYLDPETLNGLNLYIYCGNNPIMLVDAEGNAPKWWQKLLIGIGLFIVGAAITFFTAGAGAAGLAALGTFAIGFGKATAIGMAISGTIGAISGGISGGVQGALDGFGNAASDAFMFGGLGAAISSVGNAITGSSKLIGIASAVTSKFSNTVNYPSNNGFLGSSIKVKLVKGTQLDRYGSLHGRFVTLNGVSPKSLSLPPDKLGLLPTNLIILKNTKASIGIAAPWFGQDGMGIQIMFSKSILKLIKKGMIGIK